MKQAHATYDRLTDFVSKTVSAWTDAMPLPMATGFKDVRERAMDFATENAEAAFTFAGKVCNAKTPQEILTLQTQFAQERMQTFVTNTRELHGLIGETLRQLQRG